MKINKLIMSMGAIALLSVTTVPVYAESKAYTITVNESATNEDNLSKRTTKDTDYTYFSIRPDSYTPKDGGFFAKSNQLNGSATSTNIYVQGDAKVSRDGNYKKNKAPVGVYYYMETSYGYSKTGVVKSTGLYTP